MQLCSVCCDVVNNGLDSSWSLYTGPLTMTHLVLEEYHNTNHKWHKQGATKLLKILYNYLIMVTIEYGENYSNRFEMKNITRAALVGGLTLSLVACRLVLGLSGIFVPGYPSGIRTGTRVPGFRVIRYIPSTKPQTHPHKAPPPTATHKLIFSHRT